MAIRFRLISLVRVSGGTSSNAHTQLPSSERSTIDCSGSSDGHAQRRPAGTEPLRVADPEVLILRQDLVCAVHAQPEEVLDRAPAPFTGDLRIIRPLLADSAARNLLRLVKILVRRGNLNSRSTIRSRSTCGWTDPLQYCRRYSRRSSGNLPRPAVPWCRSKYYPVPSSSSNSRRAQPVRSARSPGTSRGCPGR